LRLLPDIDHSEPLPGTSRLLAMVALVAAAAPIAVVSLLILLLHGRPVLVPQFRIRQDGRVLRCWRFRTRERASCRQGAARLRPPLTIMGRYLVSTRAAALPLLWHGATGQLNLLGPWPRSIRTGGGECPPGPPASKPSQAHPGRRMATPMQAMLRLFADLVARR
jgi:hypothetical protein